MVKGYTHVDSTERRLVLNMKAEGLTWDRIEAITERSPGTISSILKSADEKKPSKKKGAPKKLPPKVLAKVLKTVACAKGPA